MATLLPTVVGKGRGKAVAVFATICAASLLLLPASALAWEVDTPEGFVRVTGSAEDTTNVTVKIYSEYKGGDEPKWGAGFYPDAPASYDKEDIYTGILSTSGGETRSMVFPRDDTDGRILLVSVIAPGNDPVALCSTVVAVDPEPVPVYLSQTATVTVVGTPTVAMDTTVTASIGETLTVDPWGSAGLGDGWVQAFILGVSMLCGVGLVGVLWHR